MASSSTTTTLPTRRRQQYSKLLCLGCRARRIRCVLPDTTIVPSGRAQPADKACQRCRLHGLDCVVGYTTLGRPAQKRSRADDQAVDGNANHAGPQQQQHGDGFEDETAEDVDEFLITQPDGCADDGARGWQPSSSVVASATSSRPTKSEFQESMKSAHHLLSALLSRDKTFASAIGSQPLVDASIMELIDAEEMRLLDEHLVWHRLHYSDIPALWQLRVELEASEPGQSQRISGLFLLTLLCDLALDAPSPRLASLRKMQPTVRALLYHCGQQTLFALPRNAYTVLALALTNQWRPVALTSSQVAAPHTLTAIPHIIMAKYVATDLGYSSAGSRLTRSLNDPDMGDDELKPMMHECLHWLALSISEDIQSGPFSKWVRRIDPSALECLDALRAAIVLNRMPIDLLVTYSLLIYNAQMLANLRDMTEHWTDLGHLEEVIQGYRVFCDKEQSLIDQALSRDQHPDSLVPKISVVAHLTDMNRHHAYMLVVGCSMFFAIMCAAYGNSHKGSIGPEHIATASDNIIKTLHSPELSEGAKFRDFLDRYGSDRMDMLEHTLTNFITAVDTLTLNGQGYIGRTREVVASIVFCCKDIVENNAARIKGWEGLHDRVDVQLILFHESARRLEAMSASAGTSEAMAKGCLLTAGAKLVRSLHRILQGFKKNVRTKSSEWSASASQAKDPTPPQGSESVMESSEASMGSSEAWDGAVVDDRLNDWGNWPQMESVGFADIFGSAFDFDFDVGGGM